jgi:hypothetical protein
VDATATKKVDEDVVAAERAVIDKRATDATIGEMVVRDAAAAKGITMEVASQNMAESSPVSVARAKRAAVSGGPTPLSKHRFRGSWKPRHVVRPCICPSFLLCLFCFTWILRCAMCLPLAGHLLSVLIGSMVVPWGTAHWWHRSTGLQPQAGPLRQVWFV